MARLVSDFLTRMAARSRQRSAAAAAVVPEVELLNVARNVPAAPPLRLSDSGFDLIAEVKRRSPALGQLVDDVLPAAEQAQRYTGGGAAAISVLTEPEQFHGELADLVQVVARLPATPAMRKDFLVTPYQVIEARAAGAGGVLIVAAILAPDDMRVMLETALSLGMFALVEAFDEADLDRCVPVVETFKPAVDAGTARILLGVNCRNLRSLAIEFPRFETFAAQLPMGFPWVAESGVMTPDHAAEVAAWGYRLALVGTALMQSEDPGAVAQAMITAGRRAAETS